jgi:hypothetical protein
MRDGGAAGPVAADVEVNQEQAPSDYSADGASWAFLGVVDITGSSLTVSLSDVGADQFVIADAIRLEPLPPAHWPGATVPTWAPDPIEVGVPVPPQPTLFSLTSQSGGYLVNAIPTAPPADDPPVVGFFVGLKPAGEVIEGTSLPIMVTVEDAVGLVRVQLVVHSLVASADPLTLQVEPGCRSGFPDVPSNHQFCEEIDELAERGITGGYADGRFHPGATVTRQALSAWFHRLAGEPPMVACVTPPFTDVPVSHAFCDEIAWMVAEGITTGFVDGTFRPTAQVTRQALAAWFARFADSGPLPDCTVPPFSDVPADHPFCEEITWAADAGLVNGYADGTYRPADFVTRQAAAAMFTRF